MRIGSRLLELATRPHLPRRTIRLRLTLLYGGLFLVSGAALLAITYVLVVHATKGFVFQSENATVGIVKDGPKSDPKGERKMIETRGYGKRPAPPLTPRQAEAQARALEAQAERQHSRELHQLLIQSGIALAGMALLSIALGWVMAGRALRPLRRITAAARDISAANLNERLRLAGPDDELKELGDTFDELLARLEASFESQRRFVANASHELRTPLARQRALVQVALADPDATEESLRAAHSRVLASEEQLERLIDALLALSRGQAGLDHRERFDLADVAEEVLLPRRVEAARAGLILDEMLAPAPASGDPRLVERLVANLVDNALRHNVTGGRVEVASRSLNGSAFVSVTNTGPVVPPAELAQLFQPFRRLGSERTGQGLGLGLSIVRAIADAHRATVTVEARSTGGLEVEVAFASARE